MTDFEAKLRKADLIVQQNLKESRQNLRKYVEKIVIDRKYFQPLVLQMIEQQDKVVSLEQINYRGSYGGFFSCKSWNIDNYPMFMKDIKEIIGDLNKILYEKLAGRAELYFETFGLPNNRDFGIFLKLKLIPSPGSDMEGVMEKKVKEHLAPALI